MTSNSGGAAERERAGDELIQRHAGAREVSPPAPALAAGSAAWAHVGRGADGGERPRCGARGRHRSAREPRSARRTPTVAVHQQVRRLHSRVMHHPYVSGRVASVSRTRRSNHLSSGSGARPPDRCARVPSGPTPSRPRAGRRHDQLVDPHQPEKRSVPEQHLRRSFRRPASVAVRLALNTLIATGYRACVARQSHRRLARPARFALRLPARR